MDPALRWVLWKKPGYASYSLSSVKTTQEMKLGTKHQPNKTAVSATRWAKCQRKREGRSILISNHECHEVSKLADFGSYVHVSGCSRASLQVEGGHDVQKNMKLEFSIPGFELCFLNLLSRGFGENCLKLSKPQSPCISRADKAYLVQCLMFKLVLEKAEEPETKWPISVGLSKKQESSRKTSIFASLTMPKPLTVWIPTNCGKF